MAAPTVAAPAAGIESRPVVGRGGLESIALGAILATLGLATQVGSGNAGRLGELTALLDVGVPIVFLGVGYLAHMGVARAIAAGQAVPATGPWLRGWLWRIVPLTWLVTVVTWLFPAGNSGVVPTTAFSPAAGGTTQVPTAHLLTGLGFLSPYPPAAAGRADAWLWPVATVVGFLVLTAVIRVAAGARFAGADGGRLESGVIGVLATIGLVVPVVLTVTGALDGGASRWLPAQLLAFSLGMLAARMHARAEAGQPRHPVADALASGAWIARAVALGALVAMAYGLDLPGGTTLIDGWSGLLRHLGLVLVATALMAPLLLRLQPETEARRQPPTVLLAMGAGSYLWAGPLLDRWLARHPGQAGQIATAPTVAWLLGGGLVLGALSWLVVVRPLSRLGDRGPSRFVVGLSAIVGASFVARLWAIGSITSRNPGNGDPFFYHAQANMIADGVGFGEPIQWITEGRFVPSAIHPPLFTLWLTPSSLTGARTFLAHKSMAVIAGLLVVVVAALLARRLTGSDRAGWLAAGLVALYPDLWLIDGTLWPEGLYTATVGFALLAGYRWREEPSWRWAIAVGTAIGIAVLTRGEALLLLGFLCLPLVWSQRHSVVRWWVHGLVMGAVAVGLLAPWTVRNLLRFDRPVPVSTNSEEVLYYANCPDTYSGPFIGYWSFNCQERARADRVAAGLPADPPGDEAERAAAWGELGREYALEHRERWPAVVTARLNRVWDLRHAENSARAIALEGRPLEWSKAGLWLYRALLIPAAAGLWLLRRRGAAIWPLMAMLAMISATAVYAYGHIRFRTVGDLVLIVAAAAAIDALIGFRRPGRAGPAAESSP